MTKGHNQGENSKKDPDKKTKGQDEHLTNKEREKNQGKGRNADPDPSDGRKGKNNV